MNYIIPSLIFIKFDKEELILMIDVVIVYSKKLCGNIRIK